MKTLIACSLLSYININHLGRKKEESFSTKLNLTPSATTSSYLDLICINIMDSREMRGKRVDANSIRFQLVAGRRINANASLVEKNNKPKRKRLVPSLRKLLGSLTVSSLFYLR